MAWRGGHVPGTVVVSTSQRRLYCVLGGQAIRYRVGGDRQGVHVMGVKTVATKANGPTAPAQMLRSRPDLPRHMPGGMENLLGARAIYLGSSLYRIHGSNKSDTIGGCGLVRLHPHDEPRHGRLYGRVRIGTKVVVLR